MYDMTGKTVLLTGAGGEIGRATASTLSKSRARLLLHDRDLDALAPLLAAIPDATGLAADLSGPASCEGLWQDAVAAAGRVDVLINMAGIYQPAPLDDPLDRWLATWDRSLAINLVSPGLLCREAVRAFSAQEGGGIIVNIASRAAFRDEDPEYWHYAAAKVGLVAMTKTIARHYGRQGVTAFAIALGYVDTAFNQVFRDIHGVEVAAADTGLGEVALPQDIANVVAFLASGLARHATGTTIDVNGASYVR